MVENCKINRNPEMQNTDNCVAENNSGEMKSFFEGGCHVWTARAAAS